MACMFLISGLFVHDSLTRRGSGELPARARLAARASRFLLSIFVLMPIAYYPTFLRYHLPGTTDFNFFHFWWHTLTVGPWPSGPAWFLWVLLAFDAIAAAIAGGWRLVCLCGARPLIFPLRDRPMTAFVAFLIFSVAILSADAAGVRRWRLARAGRLSASDPDQPHPALSRLLLYRRRRRRAQSAGRPPRGKRRGGETLAGVARPLRVLFYGAILLLVYAHHNWVADFDFAAAVLADRAMALPLRCSARAMAFAVPAIFLRFAGGRLALDGCAAALGLRHLPAALHLHHLAAISVYDLRCPPASRPRSCSPARCR